MPMRISLLPDVVLGWQAQLSPPTSVVAPTALREWGPFLIMQPQRSAGTVRYRQWELPVL